MNRYLPLLLGVLTFVWGCQPTSDSSTETVNFGHFKGEVVASWDNNGRQMTLREPFAYVDPQDRTWLAPEGTTVDGASIPAAFWTFIGGPFEGKYRNASVVHDVGCVEMKQSWEDVHWMFYEACRCAGVSDSEAKMLYYAVYHFGPRWQPVTETVVEQVQMPDGQMVEQEVTVEHNVRMDPLPPTVTELEQVQAFVMEENPAPKEIEQLTRDSLHRRPRRGNGYKRPETSSQPGAEASPTVDGSVQANAERPDLPASGWQRPNNDSGNYGGRQEDTGNRPTLPYAAKPSDPNAPYANRNSNHHSFDGSSPRQNYSGHRSGMPLPALTPEEEQWAAGIVRQHIDQQSAEPRQATYTVERMRGGYRVLVQFLQADESGQLVASEGDQCTVRLSRQGEIREMVSGAQTNSTPPLEASRKNWREVK